jgi:hypothetical protein
MPISLVRERIVVPCETILPRDALLQHFCVCVGDVVSKRVEPPPSFVKVRLGRNEEDIPLTEA